MEKIGKRFWDRWYEADELKRVDIVKELKVEKSAISPHAIATLINSFFVDLVEYLDVGRYLTSKGVIALLKEQVRLCGNSQKTVAFNLGISPQYLCDILKGSRGPGFKILKSLGLEKVGDTYRKVR